MECLRDYIGISGCGAPEPESLVYVNSLPGINTFLVGKIADREQVTYLNVWRDVQNRALKKFETSVIAAFRKEKKLRVKTISQLVDMGRLLSATSATAASAQYRGFSIELTFPGNIYSLESSLQVIWLESISFYSPIAVTGLAIKAFDIETGDELDDFTRDVVIGWNKIVVARSYDSYRMFIAYDASTINSAGLSISDYVSDGCQYCADHIFGCGECNAAVSGRTSDDLSDPVSGTTGSDSFGLSGVFSIRCRYDWVVCNNRDLFQNALLYLIGAELTWERIHTDRLNRYTTIDLQQAETLHADFLSQFDKELAIAVSGIDISSSDCCIECVAQIQKPMMLP